MKEFIAKYREQIVGLLSGFDRVVFRGTLRRIAYEGGMRQYLNAQNVLLKEFGEHVEAVSAEWHEASLGQARELGRAVEYVKSSRTDKEEMARKIMRAEGITPGRVCVLRSVEPCRSFAIRKNREAKKLERERADRKCLHLYHYQVHPVFGFMHARIQTWFPFSIQVVINGREWLAREMDKAGLEYVRQRNCFPWIADWGQAQRLMSAQVKANWPRLRDGRGRELNPAHRKIFGDFAVSYYWSTHPSEWATDVMFRDGAMLRRLYPRWLNHAMTTFGSTDVMRYLGRRLPLSGAVPKRFRGEAVSDLKGREEGIRIKHSVNGNSIKLYDKAYTVVGNVLRAEATFNNAKDVRVYRPIEGDPDGEMAWRPMRKGIADLHGRSEISHKATERYLDALAGVDDDTTLEEILGRLGQGKEWQGRRVRGLRPLAGEDRRLLEAVSRGEFTLTGLRNRDLQAVLFSEVASTPEEARRRSAWVGRQLRLLRAHGIVPKVGKTHRYQMTNFGRQVVTALLTALRSSIRQLTPVAA